MNTINLYGELSHYFDNMSEGIVALTWVAIAFTIRLVAVDMDQVTIADILAYGGSYLGYNQVMAVLLNAWQIGHGILGIPLGITIEGGQRIVTDPLGTQSVTAFFDIARTVIGTYDSLNSDLGITSDWIDTFLGSSQNNIARQVMRDLAAFRR